jgi:hypothetical protein
VDYFESIPEIRIETGEDHSKTSHNIPVTQRRFEPVTFECKSRTYRYTYLLTPKFTRESYNFMSFIGFDIQLLQI